MYYLQFEDLVKSVYYGELTIEDAEEIAIEMLSYYNE